MKLSPLVAVVPVLVFTLACTTQNYQVPAGADNARVAEIIEREQRLTSAITQWQRGVVSSMLAKDFRCAVADHPWFTFDREPSRTTACTGFGHDRTKEGIRADWLIAVETQAPRKASIDDMAVKLTDDGALVVSLQSYSNWQPYQGFTPRRSRVTDKWIREDGEWRLLRRYSEPLAADAVATLFPR